MRRRVIVVGLIVLALPAALLPVLVQPGRPPAPEPAPVHIPAPVDPYDSVRTDLSDYAWPTDASRAITSTFGEYRRTHFHAGIDISTNDQNGYRVFASRSGYVSRIVISDDGYGKILYVRHADGYTTTYAHLQRFAPPIEEHVRREQMLRESYPVRVDCDPGDFPVRKGDLIAYSGETGTGTSHLHFEIRDENLNAVSPLQCPAFTLLDRLAPEIRQVAVVPLQPESVVAGDNSPCTLRPSGGSSPKTLPDVTVQGAFGLAVYARDRSDGSRYSHGIYRYDLALDGRPFVTYRIDRVPFHESQQIALHYNQELLRSRRGRFEKLYVDTRNTIPFLRHLLPGDGIVMSAALEEGPHRYSITAEDNSGNSTTVEGTLIVRIPPRFSASLGGNILTVRPEAPTGVSRIRLEGLSAADSRWREVTAVSSADSAGKATLLRLPERLPDVLSLRLESHAGTLSEPQFFRVRPSSGDGAVLTLTHSVLGDRVQIELRLSEIPDGPPVLTLAEGPNRHGVPLRAVNPRLYTGWLTPVDTADGERSLKATAKFGGTECSTVQDLPIFPLALGRRGQYRFDEGRLIVLYDSLSVYSTLLLTVAKSVEGGSPVYALGPPGAVLRGGITLRLRHGAQDSSTRLYFSNSGGSWQLLGGQWNEDDGTVSGRLTRFLGDITLLPDTTPPWAGSIRVRSRSSRKTTITFRYGDDRSGVDSQELKTYIDGTFVIPEIDGEHRKVVIETTEPLSRGSHRLTIHLKDHLGNASVTDRSFSVR